MKDDAERRTVVVIIPIKYITLDLSFFSKYLYHIQQACLNDNCVVVTLLASVSPSLDAMIKT